MNLLAQMAADWHQWGPAGAGLGGVLGVMYALVRVIERYLDRRPSGSSGGRSQAETIRADADHDLLMQMGEVLRQVANNQVDFCDQLADTIKLMNQQILISEKLHMIVERLDRLVEKQL